MEKTFNQAVVPGALILRPQPPALLLDRHYWWLTMAWNGQRGRVDIDGASETLQRKEREGRKEEKDYGRQGLKVKKNTHTPSSSLHGYYLHSADYIPDSALPE